MTSPGKPSALLVLALLGIGLAGCGGDAPPEHRARYPVLSPNGEPLSGGKLGQATCQEAMARWFERVDADHDGTLSRDEFLADASRQFAAMDLDHDGLITPAELAAYRAPFITVAPPEPARRAEAPPRQADIGQPGGGGRPGGGALSRTGGARRGEVDPSADQPDPVMAADVNLRNQVSRADFLAHAERSFAALDSNRDGRLSRAEILRSCPPEK